MDKCQTPSPVGIARLGIGSGVLLLILMLFAGVTACGEPEPVYVTVMADGQEQWLRVTNLDLTVRDLLEAGGIEVGPLDQVEPDLYVGITEGMSVVVTRVTETFVTEKQTLPFDRKTVKSEGVLEGEHRLLQAGSNGELEITYRVTFENGVEVQREEVSRQVLAQPVDETVLIGVQGALTSVPISGTIAYLSGGNAWIMRQSNDLRRNLTGSGDLDGRVFALSRDGVRLLFTRSMPGADDSTINSLWLARTSLVGEEPQYLGITNVVWAEWAPNGQSLAYSTAERTGGVPGWRANNDLWVMTLADEEAGVDAKIEQVLLPTAEIPYAWWGRLYSWSPDGLYLAYAQADEVGILSLRDGVQVPLVSFPEYRTQSHWAWVPSVSWSPDGHLLSFVTHESDQEGLPPEDSPVFGLWTASIDGEIEIRLAEEVGMWAQPRWSWQDGGLLAYGQAQSPRNSQDSRYELFVMDRDGSNKVRLFPREGFMGLIAPDVAWSPDDRALLFEYEGNLYTVDLDTADLVQLTSDGQSTHPRWAE
ncbi:MAG: G5 domain-containing protein [Anaerolineae bacterium]